MNGTEHFKRTIQAYLEQRAAEDELFAVSYKKPNKNMDDCITYILQEVQKSGCNGFTDGEIYSLSVDSFNETDLVVGSPISCNVKVNHVVELTAEEKEEARKDAIKRAQDEAYRHMTSRKKPTAKTNNDVKQMSLF
ncbi:PcfK-like family protein [Bacteroides graminisolvens]|uniref:PcfK-like family protein n=1 Tax=Bacteroides graminisolvens TaxID=477666 RepID=UPI00240A7E23|nr:PcfK-like family protein [Bacteroides graminisolvens]